MSWVLVRQQRLGMLKLACTSDGCAWGWGHDGETGRAIVARARWLGVGYLHLGADSRG
jgi:hypothetical protein